MVFAPVLFPRTAIRGRHHRTAALCTVGNAESVTQEQAHPPEQAAHGSSLAHDQDGHEGRGGGRIASR